MALFSQFKQILVTTNTDTVEYLCTYTHVCIDNIFLGWTIDLCECIQIGE